MRKKFDNEAVSRLLDEAEIILANIVEIHKSFVESVANTVTKH